MDNTHTLLLLLLNLARQLTTLLVLDLAHSESLEFKLRFIVTLSVEDFYFKDVMQSLTGLQFLLSCFFWWDYAAACQKA